jgi:GNAT superfamily N-acetyltransferase
MQAEASEITMRAIHQGDAALYREIRLRGLKLAPDSFGQHYADEVTKPLQYWRDVVHRLTTPGGHTAYFLLDGQAPVGVIHGFVRGPEQGSFGGLWIDPGYRRRGLARRLIETILQWARARDLKVMRLWSVDGNQGTLRLYQDFGFRPTGTHKPLVTNPALTVSQYELTL